MYNNTHSIYTGVNQVIKTVKQATAVEKPVNPKPIKESTFILKSY